MANGPDRENWRFPNFPLGYRAFAIHCAVLKKLRGLLFSLPLHGFALFNHNQETLFCSDYSGLRPISCISPEKLGSRQLLPPSRRWARIMQSPRSATTPTSRPTLLPPRISAVPATWPSDSQPNPSLLLSHTPTEVNPSSALLRTLELKSADRYISCRG